MDKNKRSLKVDYTDQLVYLGRAKDYMFFKEEDVFSMLKKEGVNPIKFTTESGVEIEGYFVDKNGCFIGTMKE